MTRFRESLMSLPRELALWTVALLPAVLMIGLAPAGDAPDADVLPRAAQRGDVASADSALAHGVNVDQPDSVGFTPLMIAARAGQTELVERLLQHGAKIDAIHPVWGTPLMLASLNGRGHIVHILLAHHANPNCRIAAGQTALSYALMSESASSEITGQLLAAGAEPDEMPARELNEEIDDPQCSDQ